MVRGRKDNWSKVSITFEEDSRRIMGADITMFDSRSGTKEKHGYKLEISVHILLLFVHV